MLLHAPLPPASPQPPEEPPLPDEDEELSSKESEYESSDDEDRQRFVISNICLDSKKHRMWERDFLALKFCYNFLSFGDITICPSPAPTPQAYIVAIN